MILNDNFYFFISFSLFINSLKSNILWLLDEIWSKSTKTEWNFIDI